MIHTARRGSFQGGNGVVERTGFAGERETIRTLTCAHCSAVVLLRPDRTRPRGRCVRCSRYLCDPCAALLWQTGECNATEEMIDLALAHPGQGPFLLRTADKRPVYDTRLRDARRLW